MTSVLVTGGAGRLGRSVVAALAASGRRVVSVDRMPPATGDPSVTAGPGARHGTGPDIRPDLGPDGVEHLVADLSDPAAAARIVGLVRPDEVVHLAAIAVPFSAPEHTILTTNTALAHSVIGAAVAGGATRVLVASSPTVAGYGLPSGWRPERLPLDEDSPVAPWNAYALSKAVAEATMRMFALAAPDVHASAFRPCYVIAPEEWLGAPTQQGHTVRERLADPALAAPSLFNYVDARDAGAFAVRALDAAGETPSGETYLVGADDALATAPLSELLPRHLPLTAAAARELTGTRPAFSNAKAARLLGWRPEHSWRTALAPESSGARGAAGPSAPGRSAPGRAAPGASAPVPAPATT
ncbi:NAD-dependent epimerase/dehydratase family protein [Agromyces sp. NPDC058110]|uniref:NAD-dependent epimerase/dehydratase family protein n=1 Tax=Agromyces sp. NPDC058110 TaxID=3346345 RepID=UPI0036DA3A9E